MKNMLLWLGLCGIMAASVALGAGTDGRVRAVSGPGAAAALQDAGVPETAVAEALGLTSKAGVAPKVFWFVLVDDLGWGNVGFHRDPADPEVRTPNIDALVADGVEFTRHYVHKFCTPTRSSFLSGRLPVHVQTSLANPEDSDCGIPYNMTGIGSVMKAGGYQTAIVGKWDAGMATYAHTPTGRGFDQSLVYFEHKNSYWTQIAYQSSCTQYDPTVVDLWENNVPAHGLNGTSYEEYMFRDRILDILDAHNPSDPLFLVYTPHVAHCPLQVPPDVLDLFRFEDDEAECQAQTPVIFPGSVEANYSCRAQYHAMVSILDDNIGIIRQKLESKGMWEDTLMVLSTDNGGPLVLAESGASNAPLRGGKYSEWEGGVRGTAFAAGGFLPDAVRGTINDGIMHITDWYRTFAEMVGVDPTDHKAAAAGLPPIDGVNVWPLVSGANSTSPRNVIPFSNQTLLRGDWKLIRGTMGFASWQGSRYPNASSPSSPPENFNADCGKGCLYNVSADPTEHNDVAAANPDVVASMSAELDELAKSFYSNSDSFKGSCPDGIKMPCACYLAPNLYGNFLGPWAMLDNETLPLHLAQKHQAIMTGES